MPRPSKNSSSFQIILLADVSPRPDGTFILHPKVPDSDCDTWIEVKDAAQLIGLALPTFYLLIKDGFFVCRYPLDRKILVSLKSVRAYYQATVNPAFWTVATKTKDLNDALDAGKPIMGCALDDWCLLSMQVTDPIGRDLLGCNS
jgi:predicted DNA-binding transcriptional regulator AlpA